MKRLIAFVLLLAFAAALSGCSARTSKKDIIRLVENNYDAIAAACRSKDADALLAIEGIDQVRIVDGYVLVCCEGTGIAPSSQDYGFYYTDENKPVGVSCNLDIACHGDAMQPEGSGYKCTVDHNTFYTERITENIYFYSNTY